MRRTLIALAAGCALVATMALPAGADMVTAHPGGGHGGGHRGGGHYGGGGDHGGRGDHGDHGDHGGGWRGDHGGRDGHHRDGRYRGPDGYYFGPGYDGPYYDTNCPDGGYYDADGMYWYWDPDADAYVACPGR